LIITGQNKRAIEEHFDRSSELKEKLKETGSTALLADAENISNLADNHYIRQKEQEGLGDAILSAEKHCNEQVFPVLLGDTILFPIKGFGTFSSQMIDTFAKYRSSVIVVEKAQTERIKNYGLIDGKEIGKGLFDISSIVEKPQPEDAPSNLGGMASISLRVICLIPSGLSARMWWRNVDDRRSPTATSKIRSRDELHAICIGDKLGWMKANLSSPAASGICSDLKKV
jgi:UTP--glucose-1-phosphate uridylyltransferase